jgi:hypothetical protein
LQLKELSQTRMNREVWRLLRLSSEEREQGDWNMSAVLKLIQAVEPNGGQVEVKDHWFTRLHQRHSLGWL